MSFQYGHRSVTHPPKRQLIKADGFFLVPLATPGKFAAIDAEDVAAVQEWSWSLLKQHGVEYARANVALADGTRKYTALHLFIVNPPSGVDLDHIDGDGLNNRRTNLRVCSHQKNMANMRRHSLRKTSRFKGVSWYGRDSKWRAYIIEGARQFHLGYWDKEVDAAVAYDVAARRMFGEFSHCNFPSTNGAQLCQESTVLTKSCSLTSNASPTNCAAS